MKIIYAVLREGFGKLSAAIKQRQKGTAMKLSLVDRGRMSREVHVRICEGVGMKFPHATPLLYFRITLLTARTSIEVSRALAIRYAQNSAKMNFFQQNFVIMI